MCAISTPNRSIASASSSAAYDTYRNILSQPLQQADNVSPDYKTQAGALLYGDPYDFNSLNAPDSIADYFRAYY